LGFWEMVVLALGLSMDAAAVAAGIGMTMGGGAKKPLVVGAYFGAFQGLMPVLGYFAAIGLAARVAGFAHWIAFALLAILGARMISGGIKGGENPATASLSPRNMLPLAVATSIDALAVGITLAFLQVNIAAAAGLIAGITFAISALAVILGAAVGAKLKSKAAIAGGIILIVIGLRMIIA